MSEPVEAFFDLLDALTGAGQVSSPAALSEETPFSAEIQFHIRHAAGGRV
jgi:hypothetical protein